jgi:hypothetical protein
MRTMHEIWRRMDGAGCESLAGSGGPRRRFGKKSPLDKDTGVRKILPHGGRKATHFVNLEAIVRDIDHMTVSVLTRSASQPADQLASQPADQPQCTLTRPLFA